MSYAIRKDKLGWRAVNSIEDVQADEDFSDTQPAFIEVKIDPSILRQQAYVAESDPLFFKEQRKEVPEGTWLAKVAEIKERFPNE